MLDPVTLELQLFGASGCSFVLLVTNLRDAEHGASNFLKYVAFTLVHQQASKVFVVGEVLPDDLFLLRIFGPL